MCSHQELLGMVVTEALDGPLMKRVKTDFKKRTVQEELVLDYNLRLIKHEDGALEWRDD